jgi:hypothetical protein
MSRAGQINLQGNRPVKKDNTNREEMKTDELSQLVDAGLLFSPVILACQTNLFPFVFQVNGRNALTKIHQSVVQHEVEPLPVSSSIVCDSTKFATLKINIHAKNPPNYFLF